MAASCKYSRAWGSWWTATGPESWGASFFSRQSWPGGGRRGRSCWATPPWPTGRWGRTGPRASGRGSSPAAGWRGLWQSYLGTETAGGFYTRSSTYTLYITKCIKNRNKSNSPRHHSRFQFSPRLDPRWLVCMNWRNPPFPPPKKKMYEGKAKLLEGRSNDPISQRTCPVKRPRQPGKVSDEYSSTQSTHFFQPNKRNIPLRVYGFAMNLTTMK